MDVLVWAFLASAAMQIAGAVQPPSFYQRDRNASGEWPRQAKVSAVAPAKLAINGRDIEESQLAFYGYSEPIAKQSSTKTIKSAVVMSVESNRQKHRKQNQQWQNWHHWKTQNFTANQPSKHNGIVASNSFAKRNEIGALTVNDSHDFIPVDREAKRNIGRREQPPQQHHHSGSTEKNFIEADVVFDKATKMVKQESRGEDNKPSDTRIPEKVDSFEVHLEGIKTQDEIERLATKAKYRDALESERKQVLLTLLENSRLKHKLSTVGTSNQHLRQLARDLQSTISGLVAHLQMLQANVSLALDFADTMIEGDSVTLRQAPEVAVLEKLEERDAALRAELLKMERFNEIASYHEKAALLQFASKAEKFSRVNSPKELTDRPVSTLSIVGAEQDQVDASLKEAFDKEASAQAKKLADALREQERLNISINDAEVLNGRLVRAVQTLRASREALVERIASFDDFTSNLFSRMSSQQFASVVSLLQMESNILQSRKDSTQPNRVQHSATVEVETIDELRERLSKMQYEVEHDLSVQRAMHRQKLNDQLQAIVAAGDQVKNLENEIKPLERKAQSLKTQAQGLVALNLELRENLEKLDLNLTLAQQLIDLIDKDSLAFETSANADLAVVLALNNEEASSRTEFDKLVALNRIAPLLPIHSSLLQLGNSRSSGIEAFWASARALWEKAFRVGGQVGDKSVFLASDEQVITHLRETLSKVRAHKQAAILQLQADFDKKYNSGLERLEDLSISIVHLNELKNATQNRIERLEVAVKHLRITHDALQKKKGHVLAYIRQLAKNVQNISLSEFKPTVSLLQSEPQEVPLSDEMFANSSKVLNSTGSRTSSQGQQWRASQKKQ